MQCPLYLNAMLRLELESILASYINTGHSYIGLVKVAQKLLPLNEVFCLFLEFYLGM